MTLCWFLSMFQPTLLLLIRTSRRYLSMMNTLLHHFPYHTFYDSSTGCPCVNE